MNQITDEANHQLLIGFPGDPYLSSLSWFRLEMEP